MSKKSIKVKSKVVKVKSKVVKAKAKVVVKAKAKVVKPKAKVAVKAKIKATGKLKITKPKTMKPRQKKADIVLNIPTTKEQQAGIPKVVGGDSFEGVKRIDHLELKDQIDTVFNPLHTITKTTVSDAVSDSTFIVMAAPPVNPAPPAIVRPEVTRTKE